jgi:hypothetical protein
MKTSIFCLLIFGFLFVRCEKPINVDLNSSDPKIVIEGSISDVPGNYSVKVTRSVNFDESNEFPTVSGALVMLSDDTGNTEVLRETSAGVYSVTELHGIPGRTYTLEVTDDGTIYTAISKMPLPVKIDSIFIEKKTSDPFEANARFQDPAGIENYYRLAQLSKTGRISNIIVDDDRLQDGRPITISTPVISNRSIFRLEPGDSVTLVLQSIDKNVYEYLRMLEELRQEGVLSQSVLAANPVTNFSNGALGYFSANSRSIKTIVVR